MTGTAAGAARANERAVASATADPTELLRRRYRQAELPEVGALTDTIALQLAHRSVRQFRDVPVQSGDLHAIVAAAQSAATSSNQQSWSVVAVAERERRARLAHLAGDQWFIAESPLVLIWLADLGRAARLAETAGAGFDAADYLESTLVASIDAALAAQNAVVAAESLGYGTVYIGAIRNNPREVASELQLPPRVFPVFGLAVGRPDPDEHAGVKPRLPQAAVLHHERYDEVAADTATARYEAAITGYQSEFGQPRGWAAGVVDRWRSAESLHGRHLLREHLAVLGWPNR